jgi:hypothetical protein
MEAIMSRGTWKQKHRGEVRVDEDVRSSPWITTISGTRFYPFEPMGEEVRLEDIAHSLSLRCRWGGHCRQFFSVAQHAVMVAEKVYRGLLDPGAALLALHHDSAEAYLTDLAGPIKARFKEFNDAEERIMAVIREKLGLPEMRDLWASMIHRADLWARAVEARDNVNFPRHYLDWLGNDDIGMADPIRCWQPEQAEAAFLEKHREYYDLAQSMPKR